MEQDKPAHKKLIGTYFQELEDYFFDLELEHD